MPEIDPRGMRAWSGMLGAHAALMRLVEADLVERCGLSHVEFEVLLRLSRAGAAGMTLRELAAASILTTSGMSRAVRRLTDAGLLGRLDNPADGRSAFVVLTDAGRAAFEDAAAGHLALVQERFVTRFSPAELDVLSGFWERLRPGDDGHAGASAPTRS